MFSFTHNQRIGSFVLALTGCALAVPFAAQAASYTIDNERPVSLVLGEIENPVYSSTDIEVTKNGSIIATDSDRPNSIRVYQGGGSSFTLNNSGLLDGVWGVFASATGTGSVSINNLAGADIYAGQDYGIYAITDSGEISVVNDGFISGSTEAPSGEMFSGVVGMESNGGGTISFNNSGTITGKNFAMAPGSTPAVVTAHTSGVVNLHNSGRIEAAAGETSASGTAGMGIYVTSAVTGGKVVNSGLINAATAINVQGSNVRVELLQGSNITGNVVLGGQNNTLALNGDGQYIFGDVTLGQTNHLELSFAGASATTVFLAASGVIDITGASLNLDFTGVGLSVGESYILLHGFGGIEGWFTSINGIDTGGVYEAGQTYTIGNYEVEFSFSGVNGDQLTMVVSAVPEPATYAMMVAGALGMVVLFRGHRRNRKV